MQSTEARSVRRNRFGLAIAITLGLHAATLFVLWVQPLRGTSAQRVHYVEIGVAELPDLEVAPEHSLETLLSERLESQVANLLSDASKSSSSELRSSQSTFDDQQMEADVEAELRAMEKAEFERLRSEEKDFGLEGAPDDGQRDPVDTYEEWDRRYDGQVTVAFDIPGRDGLRLDVPGYRCRGGGEVVVEVEVTGDGRVRRASLKSIALLNAVGQSESVRDCLSKQAIKSAQKSTFRASLDGVVSGTLTYRFIAQQ